MIQTEFTQLGLPDAPGVYFFMAADGSILYIGRATSLRDRVRSYFSDDLIKTRGLLLVDMVTQAKTITHIQTDSVLEAILLEASEIKKYQPPYNTIGKASLVKIM
jgi:DNA polymerase-3 subunit epsilon